MRKVLDGCRPHHKFAAAIVGDAAVVGAIDIDTLFAWIVGIFKYIRFTVGDMFPKRKIRVPHCAELSGFALILLCA